MSAAMNLPQSALEVLSGNRRWHVVHGDCRDVLPLVPNLQAVDHIITDPPYSEHVHSKQRQGSTLPDAQAGERASISRARELGFEALSPDLRAFVAQQAARLARRWVLIFHNHEMTGDWMADLERAGLQHVRCGVWVKEGATPQFTGDRPASGTEGIEIAHRKGRKRWNGGGHHGVWHAAIEFNRGGSTPRLHTTQKPLDLMIRLVEQFTDPDDLVLDPFCGSATTGVACLRTGRRFLGVELDEGYAQVAHERLSAEAQGLTLSAARAGQLPLLAVGGAR